MAHDDEQKSAAFLKSLESIKWLLCHGNLVRAGDAIRRFAEDLDDLQVDYPQLRKFARAAREFCVYIESNLDSLDQLWRALPCGRTDIFVHGGIHGKHRH